MKAKVDLTPKLVTRREDLLAMLEVLQREPYLAVDTESNSLYVYREQVCLVQFSTPQTDYLVDPLQIKDLSPLGILFDNPSIEKIFHAAEYDLLCMNRDFKFHFSNLFDTMVAARILGREDIGLGAILEVEFGFRQEKRYQRANWGQRPLPSHLLDYAHMDTHYLIPLRQRLNQQLSDRELLPLAKEDFIRLSKIKSDDNPVFEGKTVDPWRIGGSRDLNPQQAAVLMELCRYRDQLARSLNRPLFKVFHDRVLLAMAKKSPRTLEELHQVPGISEWRLRRYGHQILQVVVRGLKASPLYPPRSIRMDNSVAGRLEALRNWRKKTARKMGLASDVVLPRDLMIALAESNPRNPDEMAEILSEVPWRMQHYGDGIMEVLLS